MIVVVNCDISALMFLIEFISGLLYNKVNWGEPERAPHDQSNGDRVCLCVCVYIVRSHSVYMRVLI